LSDPDPLRQALAGPKRWRGFAVRGTVTVAVLGLIVALVSPAALVDAIRRAPPLVWLATACGLFAGHGVAALKWRALVRGAGAGCTRLQALRAHGAGLFANLFLPSLVGGDLVRAAALSRDADGAAVATGSIVDRVIDTAALAALAAAGAYLVGRPLGDPGTMLTGVGLAALALAAILAGGALIPRLLRRAPVDRLPERIAPVASRLRDAASRLSAIHVAGAFALSLAVQLSFVWLNARLGFALGIGAPFSAWLMCWPLAKLLALLPISLGGLGVREAALAGLLAGFGVPAALAVAQSLLWQTALIAVGGLAGALALGAARSAGSTATRASEERVP